MLFYGDVDTFKELVKSYGNITLGELWKKVWRIKNAHLFIKDCWWYQEPLETGDFKEEMN